MFSLKAVACLVVMVGAFRKDVPDGMCFKCEVNCIQDCTSKFHTEVMKDDMAGFMQLAKSTSKKPSQEVAKTAEQIKTLGEHYISQLKAEGTRTCTPQRGCQIAQQCAVSMENQIRAVSEHEIQQKASKELDYAARKMEGGKEHRAWTDVSSEQVTIMDLPKFTAPTSAHGPVQHEASDRAEVTLDRSHRNSGSLGGHLRLYQNNKTQLAPVDTGPMKYPLHPVKIGVFSKGGQTLTQCMMYCFAATCGCEDSPMTGTVEKTQELVKAAGASGYHTDTPPHWRYRKATKEECGAGVNKVIEGLYVVWRPTDEGTAEVCSDKMFKLKAGVSGALGLTDPLEDKMKCDCGINRLDCHEPDFGCSWSKTMQRCEFKAMHNTICYTRYKTDKTL